MKNYKKLKEKLHTDIDREVNAIKEISNSLKTDIGNLNKIAVEAQRVSEVARDVHIIIEDIDRKFEQATKLNRVDITFLFFATALQCVRQYLLTSFSERVGHDELGKQVHKAEDAAMGKYNDVEDMTKGSRYYHANLDEIIVNGVPYDVTKGTKAFDVGYGSGLSGFNHRYKTLGHDPLLGYVFGTANIMTSTLTNYQLSTFHVADSQVINRADTMMMFNKVCHRTLEQPEILAASLIKQYFHIKSDITSINGLPIPVISTLSPKVAQELAKRGIDSANVATVVYDKIEI